MWSSVEALLQRQQSSSRAKENSITGLLYHRATGHIWEDWVLHNSMSVIHIFVYEKGASCSEQLERLGVVALLFESQVARKAPHTPWSSSTPRQSLRGHQRRRWTIPGSDQFYRHIYTISLVLTNLYNLYHRLYKDDLLIPKSDLLGFPRWPI